ncbi:hypothetical protein FHR32_007990 [Streptosporangium album]|uniref:Uncharacterized protein n=1 Tax=Streptosporangium album TaxID=47479 RepID=A0A7W7WEL5_9ACTN|nr:hypothetical protein [Streptosporangium album]MBB4943590.1 hypothetical protein [Streptosporangium album]
MSRRGQGALRRLSARYGAGLRHLLALLACFVVALYVLTRIIIAGILPGFVLWFLGAVIVHDFVVLPLYSAADEAFRRYVRVSDRGRWPSPLNHVRIPAGLSGLLLLIWFPLILRASEHNYREAVGLSTAPYLGRWLLVTLVFFAVSALVYAVQRTASNRAAGRATPRTPG